MTTPVYCNGCGQRLEVPTGFAKAKMRCAECGVFTDLPKAVREQKQADPSSSPVLPTPTPRRSPARQPELPSSELEADESYTFLEPDEEEPVAPAPPVARQERPVLDDDDIPEHEVLIQGTQDDDFNPYTVTGDRPTKRCGDCDRKVEIRAKVCPHCGFNFETQEKQKRSFKPIEQHWENGWPWDRRVILLSVLLVVDFVTLVLMLINGKVGVGLPIVVITVAFQAFICGTYDKLSLTRTTRGKVTLATTWRYAFIPRSAQPHKWKEHESLLVVQTNEFDPIDWIMAIILVSWCVIPGILFWWFVIRPDKYTVYLCRDHGFPETAIFRTSSQQRADEIIQRVSEVTTLPIHR